MNKILLFVWIIFGFTKLMAQAPALSEGFKKQYEGKWSAASKYQNNTIEIKFEPGKNYAIVIDIGSGEAPPVRMRAFQKNNILTIAPALHQNDYCELEIKNGKLIFRTQPTIWTEEGKPKPPGKFFAKKVFSKVK